MNKEVKEAFALRRKLVILEYAKAIGNAAEAYHVHTEESIAPII
jgi:hypothetical protein